MITGAHIMLYSKDAHADTAFFRDVLEMPNVDYGGGWIVFKLPPTDFATHPAEEASMQAVYLMCEDIDAVVARVRSKGVECTDPRPESWGRAITVTLPGGSAFGIYQPSAPE